MNIASWNHRRGNYQFCGKKAQKFSLRESLVLDQGLGRSIGTWDVKKRRKFFPTGWNYWTLKSRQCDYVKISEDVPRIKELE